MQRAGDDFAILGDDEKCCGLYAFDLGFRREYERLKDDNLATLRNAGIERAIVACGSARESGASMRRSAPHPVIWRQMSDAGQAGRLHHQTGQQEVTLIPASAAGASLAPRTILQAIPGIQLVEMGRNQRWAWCCGGGGGVPEADPELAQWNAADRMREARETGAELVLTSSALCQRSFADLKQAALPVQDLLEFALQAV